MLDVWTEANVSVDIEAEPRTEVVDCVARRGVDKARDIVDAGTFVREVCA